MKARLSAIHSDLLPPIRLADQLSKHYFVLGMVLLWSQFFLIIFTLNLPSKCSSRPAGTVQAIEDPKVFALLSPLLFLSPTPSLLEGGSIENWSSLSWSACSSDLYLSKISSQQYSVTFPRYHCTGISVEFPRSGPQM